MAPVLRAKHVAAVAIGNALEFYDFLTFSFFAIYIGPVFFPSDDPSLSLLPTLATFGVGFLTRPIGAIVIGSMGDRVGRRPAMLLSFTLMGIAILGMALTPSYEQIGVAAPVLLIIWRLMQGFALGGEVGPSTAFLIEAAPPHRRGFYVSLQYVSQQLAVVASGVIGTTLVNVLDRQQVEDWGWRAAMLLGVAIVPVGLIIRRSLPETLHHLAATEPSPARPSIRPFLPLIVLGLVMLAAGTIGTYVNNYMATYAQDTLHLPATIAFGVIIVQGVVAITFQLIAGSLSDRIGRKPVMLIPGTILLLSIIPAFLILHQWPSVATFYPAIAFLVALQALCATPVVVLLTEQLPARVRSGTIAIVYAFAIAIFGGSAQFAVKGLMVLTGSDLIPAYYWTVALACGLVAMALVRESAPSRIRPVARAEADLIA